jgi:hypothetical protein
MPYSQKPMYKLELSDAYGAFEADLIGIKTIFARHSDTIHKARNELKIIPLHGIDTVVKAFRVPNPLNRFVYAHIRRSKAYKSFHNALKLQKAGVNTPEPIGYIEFYASGLLRESFFVAKYEPYDFTMAHVRDENPEDKVAILEAFAAFTYDLHRKGVWHVDYSGGNTLIRRTHEGYRFSLVDINRMQFRPVSGYEGLKNFNKLWLEEADLLVIARRYAALAGLDEQKACKTIVEYDRQLKAHVLRRRKLKSYFKAKK